MISKGKIQLIKSLKNKKFRYNNSLFIAEGEKWCKEILSEQVKVDAIYTCSDSFYQQIIKNEAYKDFVLLLKKKEIEQITALKTPTEVICVLPFLDKKPKEKETIVIACESIRDPGNLGTIIRTADWFGVDKIILSNDCADIYNPKVVQATMGSLLRINILQTDLLSYFEQEKTLKKYGTSLNGELLSEIQNHPKKGIFVIGNEGKGISAELMQKLDYQLKIPQFGKAESLNAAIACGIICNWIRS